MKYVLTLSLLRSTLFGGGDNMLCTHLNESKENLFLVQEGDAIIQIRQLLEMPHFLLPQVSLHQT